MKLTIIIQCLGIQQSISCYSNVLFYVVSMKCLKYSYYLRLPGCYLLLFSCCNSGNESRDSDKENSIEGLIRKNLGEAMPFEADARYHAGSAHMVRVWSGCHNIKFLDLDRFICINMLFMVRQKQRSAIQVKEKSSNAYPDIFKKNHWWHPRKRLNADEHRQVH